MEENIEIKSTAKTTAERQRAYRERLKKRDVSRLDVIVSDQAHHALACLALHSNVTQKEILERLILSEQNRILDGFRKRESPTFNSVAEIEKYISAPK